MTGRRFFQVDAFATAPFTGNPAAVLILAEFPRDEWMQAVAAEMNLSETAFAVREGEGYRLRWFTPAIEVDLCGHATLATAHVLWQEGLLRPEESARFFTRSGELAATREGDAIALDLPALNSEPGSVPPWLPDALGAQVLSFASRGQDWWIAELDSPDTVTHLRPDLSAIKTKKTPGLIVTAAGKARYDFVSRMFAPAWGIDEDPVTGAAHCALGPFWFEKTGRREFSAYQASSRGGALAVAYHGNRVRLVGHAVTVARGELFA